MSEFPDNGAFEVRINSRPKVSDADFPEWWAARCAEMRATRPPISRVYQVTTEFTYSTTD